MQIAHTGPGEIAEILRGISVQFFSRLPTGTVHRPLPQIETLGILLPMPCHHVWTGTYCYESGSLSYIRKERKRKCISG